MRPSKMRALIQSKVSLDQRVPISQVRMPNSV